MAVPVLLPVRHGAGGRVVTPADMIRSGTCSARCLLADPVKKCRCSCNGIHHGALLDVDITALVEGRRRFRRMTDLEVLVSA